MSSDAYFKRDALEFLAELRDHNDRAWFQANNFEGQVRAPFLRLITDLAPGAGGWPYHSSIFHAHQPFAAGVLVSPPDSRRRTRAASVMGAAGFPPSSFDTAFSEGPDRSWCFQAHRQSPSLEEIASMLDLTVNAVKAHLARGRARLKEINAKAPAKPAPRPRHPPWPAMSRCSTGTTGTGCARCWPTTCG
jgi:hypothetical protein